MPDSTQWPLAGEYTEEAITAALAGLPGVTNPQPGTLHGGGPAVRFDLPGLRRGGVGCFFPREYLIVLARRTTDNDPATGAPATYGHRSRRVASAASIAGALADLAGEVPAGEVPAGEADIRVKPFHAFATAPQPRRRCPR